tara:strand:- start:12393 stop:12845 length:453 start_codon:yes stop_codon:yes gene_type:complete
MLVGDNVTRGDYSLTEAKEMAENAELDLVMVGNDNNKAVCKLMDYGKFIFKQGKEQKTQKPIPIKTVRFRPTTDKNDLEYKTNSVIKFLKKGHKVKIYVFFKGRELAFKEQGQQLLLELTQELEEYGIPEAMPKMEGKNKMIMLLKPKKL